MAENLPAILVPHTGELVNAGDARACALALREIRDLESRLREAKALLSRAVAAYREREGLSGTLDLGDVTAMIRPQDVTSYAAEEIEEELRAAGMPEHRIREIVKEEISYKVVAVEAKKAARANPVYAAIIERHTTVIPRDLVVSVK